MAQVSAFSLGGLGAPCCCSGCTDWFCHPPLAASPPPANIFLTLTTFGSFTLPKREDWPYPTHIAKPAGWTGCNYWLETTVSYSASDNCPAVASLPILFIVFPPGGPFFPSTPSLGIYWSMSTTTTETCQQGTGPPGFPNLTLDCPVDVPLFSATTGETHVGITCGASRPFSWTFTVYMCPVGSRTVSTVCNTITGVAFHTYMLFGGDCSSPVTGKIVGPVTFTLSE